MSIELFIATFRLVKFKLKISNKSKGLVKNNIKIS